MDSLIISPEKIYFFEVKNYQGDYFYEADKLYKKPSLEVINPLHQLSRSESLLRQLLLRLGSNLQIEGACVFINPSFTLYQAPLDKPMIFPTQINEYMKQLNSITSKLTDKHKKLADQLTDISKTDSPYTQITFYDYDRLRKGITCFRCHSFSVYVVKRECVCNDCGFMESLQTAVLRTVKEFEVLFPDVKITTNIIHDWCQIVTSKQRIRRLLASNYKMVGVHQWAYFI
nr:nuclease-related domain-containing protein [Sediminibacillus dalangtanensis]